MSEKTLKIAIYALGILGYLAFRSGHLLIGAFAIAAAGFLTMVTPRPLYARIAGAAIMLYGLYIAALILGWLLYDTVGSLFF